MSFILHNSNKTENLVSHLAEVIKTSPLKSPFDPEIFLIQSQGMERWLSQQLAQQLGVWSNYQFLFPGKFFGNIAKTLGISLKDKESPFERHAMLWRIEALLRQLEGDEFIALSHYLSGDNIDLKRYQLAQELSQVFDQYQIMRPELLTAWHSGELLYHEETERWQRALWLEITKELGQQHRGFVWLQVINTLNNTAQAELATLLPERVFVFGMNTMPPLFLGYLQALAKHCQVHLFLLNPSSDYWADIASKRQRAIDETQFSGHPLLSSLGQQGREFQDMILEYNTHFELELDSFQASDKPNLLQRLQNDILNNAILNNDTLDSDDSISIHACHSRLREVEVLKHYLLNTLEKHHDIELRDIVVMAPDIQKYEPFIAAVFNDIQHAVADRSLRLTNQALDAFIRFLKVCQSRFGWQTVLDLLEHPSIYPKFNLTETDLELIKHWVTDTQVRWGKSAQHKGELGLPETAENTWQSMLERLLMGYCVGSETDFIHDILPYQNIEGSQAQALGGLCAFMACLFEGSEQLTQAKSLQQWTELLYVYAERLLADTNELELKQLKELLTDLFENLTSIHHKQVELSVVIGWIEGKVEERKSSNGFLRGQLTFCSMLPMRSIPFKVIALLGINDGEFPKVERKPSFDLLAQHFKKGDRSRRADDRYQFLEILLSARKQLMITYIGQSINHNETIPPSVIISELLDVLQQSYGINSEKLITRQALQAFSPRYFTGKDRLISFSQADCNTALALQQTREVINNSWWQGHLESAKETIIELTELFRFFKHPQQYFMQRQFAVRFEQLESAIQEREPFSVANLDAYTIAQNWINTRLAGEAFNVKTLQAQGHWLAGGMGELEFTRQQHLIEAFVERIEAKQLGQPLADLAIDCLVNYNQYRLIGLVSHRYQNGSLFYRYANLKGKDFMCALLHHNLMNTIEPHTTYLISSDEDLILLPEHCNTNFLPLLCEIYQQGLLSPDAFFVEAAFAYIKQNYKLQYGKRADKSALMTAIDSLNRAIEQDYELELQRLYGGIDASQLLDSRFEYYCQQLLQDVWNALH
ncbi:MAG: exodeoxyribonuclease V subunit gamma [Methylococcaceae bacterium]